VIIIQWINNIILFIAYALVSFQIPTLIALSTLEVLIELSLSFITLEALSFVIALLATRILLLAGQTLITYMELFADTCISFAI